MILSRGYSRRSESLFAHPQEKVLVKTGKDRGIPEIHPKKGEEP
jgi:hypothetical protein